MAFGFWSLMEATLLVMNGICVLHEERFLSRFVTNSVREGCKKKVKKWSRDHFAFDPLPPQHKVVLLLCFVHIFIEKPSSKVVPLIIFADRDHFFILFFIFCTLPLL